MRVDIYSAGFLSSAHNIVAKTLAEELSSNNIKTNLYYLANSKDNLFYTLLAPRFYSFILNFSNICGKLYDFFGNLSFNTNYLTRLIYKLSRLNKDNDADLVVFTHVAPAIILAPYIKNSKKVAIITDFGIAPFWVKLKEYIDYYIIPCKEMKKENIGNIYVGGIPIPYKKRKKDFQFIKRRFTVLLKGGTWGVGKFFYQIPKRLHKLPLDMIIVTGKNKKLKEKLEYKFGSEKNIFILGWVENIGYLLSLADVVISKPGGVSLYETFAYRVPIIATPPLPTQERANLEFLKENKLGWSANYISKLEDIIEELISNPSLLDTVRTRLSTLNLPLDSAKRISKFLSELCVNI